MDRIKGINSTFSREELYNLVWKEPITTIAKRINVSPRDVRQACKNFNIPVPENGHWQKLKFNKHVIHYPLPAYSGDGNIVLKKTGDKESKQYKTKVITANIDKMTKNVENTSKPNKLVVEAEKLLKSKDRHSYRGLINTWGDVLSINVSHNNITRALSFYDLLIKALNSCGHKMSVENRKTKLSVNEEEFAVALREKQKRIKVEGRHSWDSYDYQPTGILVFKWDYYSGKEWADGKTKIEEQIPTIIAWLEEKTIEIKERKEEARRWHEEYERKEQEKHEIQQRTENELNNFKQLLATAQRHRDSIIIREYLEHLKEIKNHNISAEVQDWLDWANKKADWYDPIIDAEDEPLRDVDKLTLTIKKKEWWDKKP